MRARLGQISKSIFKNLCSVNRYSLLRAMNHLPKNTFRITAPVAITFAPSILSFSMFEKNEEQKPQTPFEKSHIIPNEKMSNKTLEQLEDKAVFTVGFARKQILHFYHSAIVFLDKNQEYLVMGRQAPFFLKEEATKTPEPETISNLLHSVVDTSIDNEKKYDFFHTHPFKAEMSVAALTGAEIKEIIKKANDIICEDHFYNLFGSNCYSASVDVLVNAVEVIHKRKELSSLQKKDNDKSIYALYDLIQEARRDNFSIGVGNNNIVEKALEKTDEIMRTRGLMEAYLNKHPSNTSVDEQQMLEQRFDPQ